MTSLHGNPVNRKFTKGDDAFTNSFSLEAEEADFIFRIVIHVCIFISVSLDHIVESGTSTLITFDCREKFIPMLAGSKKVDENDEDEGN